LVTDDGYPIGSTLTITWTQVSGPGVATFSAPNAATTTASFSAPGPYALRLTASDTELTASDDVAITVNPENHAPAVNAGPDQTITLPKTAARKSVVTDNGDHIGSTPTITWTQVSGPRVATFSAPNAATTTASFSVPGSYALRLTTSDTEFTVSDDVTITVNPANQAPAVNAGPDQTITLPKT